MLSNTASREAAWRNECSTSGAAPFRPSISTLNFKHSPLADAPQWLQARKVRLGSAKAVLTTALLVLSLSSVGGAVRSRPVATHKNQFPSIHDPVVLRGLQEIFDLAWNAINSTPDAPITGENADKRRHDLAEMIILAHKSGLQPEEIKAAILGEITPAGEAPPKAKP
jgi:hypothetical protein